MLKPFKIGFSEESWADLLRRLEFTRWPDEPPNEDWRYGANRSYLQDLLAYWREGFDWRAELERFNRCEQYLAEFEGFSLHVILFRGKGRRPRPLVMTNGWPSSFVELLDLAERLAEPVEGGTGYDCFDVVIPSIPGYGYSAPAPPGFVDVDRLWRRLMCEELGYPRFVAHGTDVGARITSALGRNHGDVVEGIHIASVDLDIPPWDRLIPSAEEEDYAARVETWKRDFGAYSHIQGTFPQTLAYGLSDSPAGLAAWIVEKYMQWADQRVPLEERFSFDELLGNIMIYWDSGCINSSMRRYYDSRRDPRLRSLARVEAPTSIAMFPGETGLLVPRRVAERGYNIQRWRDMERGGHFPSLEAPEELLRDLRESFLA